LTRVRTMPSGKAREIVIDDGELNKALDKANTIDNKYFRLRAIAVLSLLRLSGKRRSEIVWIPIENFKVENDLLTVTFSLEKKKRKHKKCPTCSTKNSSAKLILQEMRLANLRGSRQSRLSIIRFVD